MLLSLVKRQSPLVMSHHQMMSYYLVMQMSVLKRVTVNNLISSAGGLTAVSLDSPELGGDLDVVTFDIVSASNRNIDILPNGSGVVNLDGDGSSGGVSISDGLIDIRTGTGVVSKVKFYCESSNAHAQTLQAQPHSASSSAVLTLPVATGTLIGSGDSGLYHVLRLT